MGDLTENFSYDEVRCKCGCGNANISKDLMNKVQLIRTVLGVPLQVNSGVRCKEYNATLTAASEDSEHTPTEDRPGEGIDLACTDSKLRWKMKTLGRILFSRMGGGPGFIHYGVRPTKPQEVEWDYY